jgi:excisionase family DNA binding protein
MPSPQSRKRSSVPAVIQTPTPTSLVPRLLSVKQAAAYTGATIWHIRELYWAKELSGFVAGRRLLLDRTSLDQWIDSRLQERAS